MAHSLTQHHTPSLPFPTGVRPNPLGFSFGGASFSSPGPSTFGQNAAIPFPRPAQQSPAGFGFGAPPNPTSHHVSPAKQGSSSKIPDSPPSKKKRSRRSSASSSSSSPAMAWATLPSPRGSRLDLGGMEDAEKRRVIKKNMKRVRQDTERQGTDNVDIGVLLGKLSLLYVRGELTDSNVTAHSPSTNPSPPHQAGSLARSERSSPDTSARLVRMPDCTGPIHGQMPQVARRHGTNPSRFPAQVE
jgi:hypothetical protein